MARDDIVIIVYFMDHSALFTNECLNASLIEPANSLY